MNDLTSKDKKKQPMIFVLIIELELAVSSALLSMLIVGSATATPVALLKHNNTLVTYTFLLCISLYTLFSFLALLFFHLGKKRREKREEWQDFFRK